jgi:F-type H+-transporting ATPase subunit b
MNELLEQLGINWSLFLWQAINFFIILIVLTLFVYKPLIKVIKERSVKIKEGLDKAEQAGIRLKEVDNIAKGKIKEAEAESINIIKNTEEKAKVLEKENQQIAEEKQKQAMELIKQNSLRAQEQANKEVLGKAVELVKKALIKTVELDPKAIDEKLIKKAVDEI